MEVFLNEAFAALNAGVDQIFGAPLESVLIAYAAVVVYRVRTALLQGVPSWLHAVIASGIDSYLMPIAINAVRAAEEYGARLAKQAIADGKELAAAYLSAQKLQYARRAILDKTPDWLVSDARLGQLIDAALVAIGRGATKGVQIGVEYVEDKISEIPPPPAA